MNQTAVDKIQISGWVEQEGRNHSLLQATCHSAEEVLAKEILKILYEVEPTHWDVEFQNDSLAFWCGLHPTFGCRLRRSDLDKGMSIIRRKGHGLIARIKAGAC